MAGSAPLSRKVKTALGETRILILGAQILLGFGFRGVFQDGYENLPLHARHANAAALLLMVATVALLIAPDTYHQIVLGGEDTGRLHRFVSRMADLALYPFAMSLGLALFIAGERIFGLAGGLASGLTFAVLALLAWCGLGRVRRRYVGHRERAAAVRQIDMAEQTPLHQRIEQMLTEARVILPGAQALLGFQLAIILTTSFEKLPASSKLVHAASLGCIALAIILLMAPATYHRIVFAGEDTEEIQRFGSRFVTAATVPLALGLAGDIYVVIARIAEGVLAGAVAAGVSLALLVGLWHLLPLAARRQRMAGGG